MRLAPTLRDAVTSEEKARKDSLVVNSFTRLFQTRLRETRKRF
jgi:hypothetical protein